MRHIFALIAVLGVTGTSSWNDPSGDAPGAPDITQVAVSATGSRASFIIRTSSAADWDGAVAFILLDTRAGGEGNGTDEQLTLHSLHDQITHERWNGTAWEIVSPSQASFSLDGSTLTMSVPLSELGNPSQIGFTVETRSSTGGDNAPDVGQWRFRTAPQFTPAQPVHGRVFVVTGAVGCKAKLRGKTLPGACRWKIPADARGAQLILIVGGQTYRFRVR